MGVAKREYIVVSSVTRVTIAWLLAGPTDYANRNLARTQLS